MIRRKTSRGDDQMKSHFGKKLALGVVIGSIAVSSAVYAATNMINIQVSTKPVSFQVNEQKAGHESMSEAGFYNGKEHVPAAFNHNGTVYVPIRLAAEILGKEVGWDGKTGTVLIDDPVHGIVAGDLEPSLAYETDTFGNQQFTFTVKNQTEHEQVLTFTSGQQYDYVLKDSKGNTIKHLAAVSSYIQAIQEVNLKQGEVLTFEETIQDLEPGDYTIEFVLTDQTFKPKLTQSFTVK
jgi:hypothetical protein